jgi:hypothetical protein
MTLQFSGLLILCKLSLRCPDRRTVIFSWFTNQSEFCRAIYLSRKVFERDVKEVSDGIFYTCEHTYGGWLQAQ